MDNLSVVKKNYIDYINKIIENNKVSHAYLIEINDYDTDKKYIFDFIKMIICNISYDKLENENNNIINLIDDNNYPDIKVIEPEGATIKKSQMIDLQKDYSNKSLLDGKRIYVVKDADKLNPASANTILKFLEEPEEDIIAILLTTNRYKIIETILSRCQILTLKENSIPIIEDDVFDLLKCVVYPNDFYIKYNSIITEVIPDKDIAREKLSEIENIIISYLNNKYEDKEIDEKLEKLFKDIESKKLLNILSIIEEEIKRLEFNVNYKLWLDALFSRLTIGG
jgi:DNA polymerase-3 subunit delta'